MTAVGRLQLYKVAEGGDVLLPVVGKQQQQGQQLGNNNNNNNNNSNSNMSSYSSSFFTGNGNNASSKRDFGKPMRDLFSLEEGTGEHYVTIRFSAKYVFPFPSVPCVKQDYSLFTIVHIVYSL